MTHSPTLISSTRTLWMLTEWRCEVHPNGRLRLYHGAELIAEHQPGMLDHVQDYAEIWQAAISDLTEVTAPSRAAHGNVAASKSLVATGRTSVEDSKRQTRRMMRLVEQSKALVRKSREALTDR